MTVIPYPHWNGSSPLWNALSGAGTPATRTVELTEVTGGTVSASSVYSTSVAAFARDGDAGTQWHSLNTAVNPWIMLDFATAQTISRVTIQQRAEATHWFKDVLVEYSTDNTIWVPVYRLRVASPVALTVHTVEFEPVSARYWRLRMTGLNSTADWYFVVQEWKLYGAASPVTRLVRVNNALVGLTFPNMAWLGVIDGTRVFIRGEYRTAAVNDLGGYGASASTDFHKTVGDSAWHPFQCVTVATGDTAQLWANDPAFGWIEFRNVVLDTVPMAMGWDGNTWKFVPETWDGNKWRGDAEIWNGKEWFKIWETRAAIGADTERWSPWMEVRPVGSAGAAPIAVFNTGWTNYGDGNWATVKWRFSDRGQLQIYGLVRATQVFTPVVTNIISVYVPASSIPPLNALAASGSLQMSNCVSSHAPLGLGGASLMRIDTVVNTSGNPTAQIVMVPNGSPTNIVNGDWIGMNVYVDLTQGDY